MLIANFFQFRLDGVSSRFQETSAEFEQARNKARKAKIEFETVKKNRSAMSCIDSIMPWFL